MQTSPHLHFKGNCDEAFRFYAELFGGKIVMAVKFGETPSSSQVPLEARDYIAHARLEIGTQRLLGCDTPPPRYQVPQGFNVMVEVAKPADAERIFMALSRDGTVGMPFAQTFWAYRFGTCTDRFGIPWMVNCEKAS
jgi:PhnB protein